MTVQTELRYRSVVTEVGELVGSFREQGVLVFFGEQAPEELHEFSVLHRADVTTAGVQPGDVVVLGDTRFPVLAVGDCANDNLAQLGHLDLKANGLTTAPLPGDVCVAEGELPDIVAGTSWSIEAG